MLSNVSVHELPPTPPPFPPPSHLLPSHMISVLQQHHSEHNKDVTTIHGLRRLLEQAEAREEEMRRQLQAHRRRDRKARGGGDDASPPPPAPRGGGAYAGRPAGGIKYNLAASAAAASHATSSSHLLQKQVQSLTEQVAAANSQLETLTLAFEESELTVSILEEALQVKASELGLSTAPAPLNLPNKFRGKGAALKVVARRGASSHSHSHSSSSSSSAAAAPPPPSQTTVGARLLSDCSRYKAELHACAASLSEARGEVAGLKQQLASCAHASSEDRCDRERLEASNERLQEAFGKLDGKEITTLEEEKEALLDYVAESLEQVQAIKAERDDLEQRLLGLTSVQSTNETLKKELQDALARTDDLAAENRRHDERGRELARDLENKNAEAEEMASMQLELLRQAAAAADDAQGKEQAAAELKERLREVEGGTVPELSGRLGAALHELALRDKECLEIKAKLGLAGPKLEAGEVELRVLRRRLAELEGVEVGRATLEAENRDLRTSKNALDRLESELRGTLTPPATAGGGGIVPDTAPVITGAPASRSSWHSAWVQNCSGMRMLSPALSDRVVSLLNDYVNADTSLQQLSSLLVKERKETSMERRALSDAIAAREQESKELADRVRSTSAENAELRSHVERARSAETATSQLRTVWLSHCQEMDNFSGGGSADDAGNSNLMNRDVFERLSLSISEASDVEVVHAIGRSLFAGRQASARASMAHQRLVESDALNNMHQQSLAKAAAEEKDLTRQLLSSRASYEADITALKSENGALSVELESAAELAERQGALAITLEGRVSALGVEREALANQCRSMREEVEHYRGQLCVTLGRVVENVISREVLARAGVDVFVLQNHGNPMQIDEAVFSACKAMVVLGEKVPELTADLNKAKAKAEMALLVGGAAQHGNTTLKVSAGTPHAVAASETTTMSTKTASHNDENNNLDAVDAQGAENSSLFIREETSKALDTIQKQKQDLARMQQKYNQSSAAYATKGPVLAFPMDKESIANRQREQQERISRLKGGLQTPLGGRGGEGRGGGDIVSENPSDASHFDSMTPVHRRILPAPMPTPTGPAAGATAQQQQQQQRAAQAVGGVRPPSPGTLILQERLRKAQATFANLSR